MEIFNGCIMSVFWWWSWKNFTQDSFTLLAAKLWLTMIKLLILAVMNNCTLFTISLQKFATHMITLEHGGRGGVDTDLCTIEHYLKLYVLLWHIPSCSKSQTGHSEWLQVFWPEQNVLVTISLTLTTLTSSSSLSPLDPGPQVRIAPPSVTDTAWRFLRVSVSDCQLT